MIIGRARKSFLFSIGLLIVGFIAIGGALVYRSMQTGVDAGGGTSLSIAAVKVPAGAEVLSAVAAGGQVTVTYRNGATTSIRVFDGRTGDIIREIAVVSE